MPLRSGRDHRRETAPRQEAKGKGSTKLQKSSAALSKSGQPLAAGSNRQLAERAGCTGPPDFASVGAAFGSVGEKISSKDSSPSILLALEAEVGFDGTGGITRDQTC